MEWPTLNHVFYIPLMIGIGVLFGMWWGRRSLMIRLAEQERSKRLREQRRNERRERLQQETPDATPAVETTAHNE